MLHYKKAMVTLLLATSMLLSACGGDAATSTPVPAPTDTTAPVAAAPTNTTAMAATTDTPAMAAMTDTPAMAAMTDTPAMAAMTNTPAMAAATDTPAMAAATDTPAGAPTAAATATLVQTGAAGPDTLTVLSLWGGSEQAAFQKVLDEFTAKTGIKTQYQQARDFIPALRTMIAAGSPPMVAIIPRPGVMSDLVNEGDLKPLTDLGVTTADIDAGYSQAWKDLGTVNGKLYGIAVKANSKSTVWYHPDSFKTMNFTVPKTWQDMIDISDKYVAAGKTPWAVGGGDSWTLTDWFESVYLRVGGPDKYNQLFQFGKLPFTDPSVVKAVQTMNQIVANPKYVAGGPQGVLGTKFTDGIGLVFGKTPAAEMYYEGGFVSGIALGQVNPDLKIHQDIDFFPFPPIDPQFGSPVLGGGDQLSAFTDNPQVRAFVKFMISKDAGETWAKTGAIVSPNKQVDPSVYPNDLTRQEAAQLGAATVFRFDGSDQLPGTLSDDWGTALQGMVTTPADIEKILGDFDAKAAQEFKR